LLAAIAAVNLNSRNGWSPTGAAAAIKKRTDLFPREPFTLEIPPIQRSFGGSHGSRPKAPDSVSDDIISENVAAPLIGAWRRMISLKAAASPADRRKTNHRMGPGGQAARSLALYRGHEKSWERGRCPGEDAAMRCALSMRPVSGPTRL